MNLTKKWRWVSLITSLLLCIIFAFLFISTLNKNNTVAVQLDKAHSEYRSLGRIDEKALIGEQVVPESTNVSRAKDKVRQFADTYFTYKGADSYLARKDKLATVMKLSDDNLKTLFAPDDEQTQVDRIKNLALRSDFKSILSSTFQQVNANKVELVSIVSVNAGSDDLGIKTQKVTIHSIYDIDSGYLTNIQINEIV
ncbi:hypothetical protein WOSG25_050520 [Weissella oryzae SG25]|uniref:Uncharacterized protein n=1 Tax=Weissella oryzae (strain DSM 25784 / JCM 18191 / LMG 30913 / SG25) TaxID=1329250 RepID=A0A069CSM1_WEIOS|nr:hypothetical protein [Weissella oryzae]GAK30780.1 hypothetical protein WOSG25_050520 [Weissella oryzae SG25]